MPTKWDKTCLLHLFVLLPRFVSIMITSSQLVSSSELQMLLTIIDSISLSEKPPVFGYQLPFVVVEAYFAPTSLMLTM